MSVRYQQKTKSGFMLIELPLIVITVILTIICYYLYLTFFQPHQPESFAPVANNTSPSPTPTLPMTETPSPFPTPTINPHATYFQKLLATKCTQRYGQNGSYGYVISLEDLPFTIDQSKIDILFGAPGVVTCFETIPNQADVIITLQGKEGDEKYIYVWDKDTTEMGHGGPSHFAQGIWTLPAFTRDSTIFSIYAMGGMEPQVGHTNIFLRGVRTLPLSNGGTINITYTANAIPANDPRLIALLDTYADENHRLDSSVNAPYMQAIKNTFFSNANTIASPERDTLAQMRSMLNAFSAR